MKAIAIGASSGGPPALEHVLSKLPKDLGAIVIVFQHIPGMYTRGLADRLDKKCPLTVVHLDTGTILKENTVYVVPGNDHLFITAPNMVAYLLPGTGIQNPSIDMGFTSVAEHFGPDTLGIVLTGMGADGVIGCKAIKQLGGKVLVQNRTSSAVYGMPFAVTLAGYADEVLDLERIPVRIVELVKGGNGG